MAKGKAYSKQSVKKTGRERKEKLVAEIIEKLDSSTGLVFTDYKGITHQQMESLRRELKSVDASLLIAKNSLMKISLSKSKNFADFKDNDSLAGSAATLFIGKETIEPLKKLQKSIKDTGLPTIKFGILEGQLLDEAGVIKLASLPTREVLLAQFVGMLNAPIQGFVSGLNAIPQKFVMTLDAIARLPRSEPRDDGQASAKQSSQPTQQPEPIPAPAAETKTEESGDQADKSADEVGTEMESENSAETKTDDSKSEAEEKTAETEENKEENTKN